MKKNENYEFGTLLRNLREAHRVSVSKLGYGLYSPAMISDIESGVRIANNRMRNRLLARLGVSSAKYADFIQYDEYDRYLLSEKLIFYVENMDSGNASNLLNNLLKTVDESDIVEHQLLLDMQARIMSMKGRPPKVIAEVYKTAVSLSIPDIDYDRLSDYAIADDEYYYIIRQLFFGNSLLSDETTAEEHFEKYKKVISSIRSSFLVDYSKSNVFPLAVYAFYDAFKKSGYHENLSEQLFHMTDEALNCLRAMQCAYYLPELYSARRDLFERIKKSGVSIAYDAEKENEFLSVFNNLYKKYHVSYNIEYSCYIHRSSDVYCISDVIKSRRLLVGMSREELADNICSLKSLARIENRKTKPQQFNVRSLFLKLGLPGDYKRSDILSNERKVEELHFQIRNASSDSNIPLALKLANKIAKTADTFNVFNLQYITQMRTMYEYLAKNISSKTLKERLNKALLLTLPKDFKYEPGRYLSNMEIAILKTIDDHSEDHPYTALLEKICDSFKMCSASRNQRTYELLMDYFIYTAYFKKDSKKATELADKLIPDCLREYRLHTVHRAVYFEGRTRYEQNINEMKDEWKKLLTDCIAISNFCKEFNTQRIYESNLEKLYNQETSS